MQPSPLYCTSCGAGNRAQATFCFNCGKPLQAGILPPAGMPVGGTGRLATGQMLNKRYKVMTLLGQGGMGAVYKAEDTQFGNRPVAAKEMSQSGLNPQEAIEAANAFKQEALMLANLKHPNLPSIYDHFSADGRWYLVMDFIEGTTLQECIDNVKGHVLPIDEVLDIGIQLCKVLSYLHTRSKPIIFRDLKPLNIMLTPEGNVYLIDFGIARLFKPGQAKDTVAYVSAGYAAPEQFGRAQTTPQSDMYSLGATLHQMLSGSDPTANSPLFTFRPLQLYGPSNPLALATLVAQMVDTDPSLRPASMAVVRQELERIETQLKQPAPPLPPPPGPLPPTRYVTPAPPPLPPTQHVPVSSSLAKPPLPKYRFLRALLVGAVAGIPCAFLTRIIVSTPSFLGVLLLFALISFIAGLITGKIAVERRMGLVAGVAVAAVPEAYLIIRLGAPPGSVTLILFVILLGCSLVSLLGAWLVTRKHPYYVKPKPSTP